MDIKDQLDQIQKSLETKAATDAKAAAEAALVEVKQMLGEAQTKAASAVTEAAELKGEVKVLKDAADKNQEAFDKLMLKSKSVQAAEVGEKSFNQILGETIERHIEEIKSYRKEQGLLALDMLPEVKADGKGKKPEVKAVGDMSIATNFPGSGSIYQDVRNIVMNPYNRVYLGDILPNSTSNGTSLVYPKENGGDGNMGVWEDRATDKPEVDYNLTTVNGYFKWLAGIVVVDRDMLDDIAFMTSYIQQKMLISLKTAENDFILNGTTGTNPVVGLLAAATAYDGDYTNNVDKIIDAGWGQIVENTNQFYQPTTSIMMPRAAVKVGLNKASGSGEYDLPDGSVAFVNGKLTVGGLTVAPTTAIGTGNFLTLDVSATQFVKRMAPELRLFEDAALAKRNKLMFRIEERATLAIFNNSAIVKGTLS